MTPAAHKAHWVATVARWLQQPQPTGHVTLGAFAVPRFVFDRLYDYQAAGVEWLDEAHVIRNCNSRTTLLVKSVRAQFKLAMTGTPVQNCLAELWSIVDFLRPGLLGTLPFAGGGVAPCGKNSGAVPV
uniref:DNA repair and recombination protein RAD26-like n=1 Tax=Dermatophagoides pteronyssinus TaxID=6956 RepID=A0A6P6YJQ5_DERPT|nr:DNA repair and recombination protein RAD26-like [Dermatophagoides pteronyssinus]